MVEKIFVCSECEAMYDLNYVKEINENNFIMINEVDKHSLCKFLENWEKEAWNNITVIVKILLRIILIIHRHSIGSH